MEQKCAVQVGVSKEKYREYRRGNWSSSETLILIEAKRRDNERRRKSSGSSYSAIRSQEMRWQWIEEYCWKNGCYRNQNQCNDRWDNLMRDYKKVKAYQLGLREDHDSRVSYWMLERHERKERGLPSNLLVEVFEALVKVVERVEERCNASMVNELFQDSSIKVQEEAMESDQPHITQEILDTDTDNYYHLNSSDKRKKRRREDTNKERKESHLHSLASSISKCASILAQALETSEEKEEKRHQDRLRIEARKIDVDKSKSEIGEHFLGDLTISINRLASSIQASSTSRTT